VAGNYLRVIYEHISADRATQMHAHVQGSVSRIAASRILMSFDTESDLYRFDRIRSNLSGRKFEFRNKGTK